MKNFRFFLTVVIATMMAGATTAQTTNHVDSLDIDVTVPGILGDLILAQTENFSDLQVLKISGELATADYDNIQRCTNLRKIDMWGVTNTNLREQLFSRSNIEVIILPEALETIDQRLCQYNHKMKSITLPPNLKKIGYESFWRCDSLEYVECPQSLEKIDNEAFSECKKLRQVVLHEGLKTLGIDAFSSTDLREIVFPNSLVDIGEYVCNSCKNLTQVTLPENIRILRYGSFKSCERLTQIDIPASVETIEYDAFLGCSALESVNLHEGLKKMGLRVFKNCTNLRNIAIPNTLVELGEDCFYNCPFPAVLDIYCIVPPYYSSTTKPFPCNTIRVPYFSIVDYKQRKGWDQFNILPLPELPDQIYICDNDVTLNLPELPAGYKPSMTIDSWTKGRYPNVVVKGNQTLSLSDYHQMHYCDCESYYNFHFYNSSLLTHTTMRADRVHVTYHGNQPLSGYQASCWNFFALPFNARVQDLTLEPRDGAPPTYFLYEYSGANRALGETGSTWVRVADNATLQAGKGYILSANCDVVFHAIDDSEKNNIFTTNDVEVTLEEHLAEFAHNRSWNLTGNPFPCWYDSRMMEFDAPFVVWEKCNYVTYTPYDDNRVLRPGEAFFVQRPVDSGTIGFPAEGRQSTSDVIDRSSGANTRHMHPSTRRVYNLTLTGNGMDDRTRLCVNPQSTMDYDMGRDASKFMSTDAQVPQLYTLHQGVRYSINERPEGDGKVTLGMRLPQQGTYTFTLATAASQPVTLIDLTEGTSTLMTDGTSYTFHAAEGDIDGRFIISLGDYTSITEVETASPQNATTVYDMQGRRVNAAGLKKGVYVVDGKKMVIGQ